MVPPITISHHESPLKKPNHHHEIPVSSYEITMESGNLDDSGSVRATNLMPSTFSSTKHLDRRRRGAPCSWRADGVESTRNVEMMDIYGIYKLVGGWTTPLKKIWTSIGMIRHPIKYISQLGWWHSQYMGKKMATKPPTRQVMINHSHSIK